jgi:hypothetical protein
LPPSITIGGRASLSDPSSAVLAAERSYTWPRLIATSRSRLAARVAYSVAMSALTGSEPALLRASSIAGFSVAASAAVVVLMSGSFTLICS